MLNNWNKACAACDTQSVACQSMPDVSLLVKTAIQNYMYHIYMVVWELHVGESFIILHESSNDHDDHAMAVYCDGDPRDIENLP